MYLNILICTISDINQKKKNNIKINKHNKKQTIKREYNIKQRIYKKTL